MVLMFYKWCVSLLLPFFLLAGDEDLKPQAKHPFYVSVTEMDHNKADKSLEFSFKFFADDFENTIESAFKTSLDVTAAKDKAAFDKYIPVYINKNFSLVADGRPAKLAYVGFEKDKESVYCYFEVTGIASIKKLQVTNRLLYDFKTEQINIMHFNVNGERKSGKLGYPEFSANFEW